MLAGLQNVSFDFGSRVILDHVTWHIFENERIGLIGYNGTGKSTILRLLTGGYTPSSGTIEKSRDTTIGYLHQDLLSLDTHESILGVALNAFEAQLKVEREIEALAKEIEAHPSDELAVQYADKLHEYELLDGYNIHHKAEEVLQGLGFANSDLQRPFREFSGGWRMRVILAQMILRNPDLLLLDEPTNHLDLPSIEWLEKYLQHYPGTVIIVSHDKYFLNRMVTKIVELYQQQLHFYTGNYEFYETEKQTRLELQQRAYENQQEYIRQQERFIERFRAKATKAAAAQSAIKKLEKLERIEEAHSERPEIRINFRVDVTPGKMICELREVSKSYPGVRILENAAADLLRGDKIALIGANGKGKSTLLRIIAGAETFSGERKWGHNVQEGFYAQHQLEVLNPANNVLQELEECGSQKTTLELRTLLGCFLFSGDDVDKKISVLSGGEKARVALAKTIIGRANFLLLDEPTNHLDLVSIELLIEALNKYPGTFIMVSHDRHFISKTANKIWEIEDGQIVEFKGTYAEYTEWKEKKLKETVKAVQEVKEPKKDTPPAEEKKEPVADGRISKEQKKEFQRLQKKFQQAEEQVGKLNREKERLEALLAAPDTYADKQKFLETESAYKKNELSLQQANREYEMLFEQMMEAEEKMK
ncbi:MAG: ATP-binding cassette domain-containing protein [Dinghuibacter sp.]|nr:ATP-binding cassette domain-containing protein [Dinghuibacter sp.]